MKTSQLVKLLQEADPTGDLEVYGAGGAIYDVERLPGYYDGSYSYIETEQDGETLKNYVISKANQKVYIDSMSAETWLLDRDIDRVFIEDSKGVRKTAATEERFKKIVRQSKAIDKEMTKTTVLEILSKMRIGYYRTKAVNDSIDYQNTEFVEENKDPVRCGSGVWIALRDSGYFMHSYDWDADTMKKIEDYVYWKVICSN